MEVNFSYIMTSEIIVVVIDVSVHHVISFASLSHTHMHCKMHKITKSISHGASLKIIIKSYSNNTKQYI